MEFAKRADGFVTLASSGPAPSGLEFTGSRTFPNYWSWLGFPAFSLPLLEVDGLPVGVQLMGFGRGDDRLASCAAWIAKTLESTVTDSPGTQRRAAGRPSVSIEAKSLTRPIKWRNVACDATVPHKITRVADRAGFTTDFLGDSGGDI